MISNDVNTLQVRKCNTGNEHYIIDETYKELHKNIKL